jgi:YVTN family beta-propeller protein
MSLQSRRKNLAQGKRSETNCSEAPPWVPPPKKFRARFSGRQMPLSPAKAGLIIHWGRLPRVPLAALASPWAKFCRLLRRLIESFNPGLNSGRGRIEFCGCVFLIVLLSTSGIAQERQRRVDDPEDQEDLNRELWEFVRKTPYEDILAYVAASQRASLAKQTATIELPNGWRIAPAGTQVEAGCLPYDAIFFAGKLVVLDTGYYYPKDKELQEVSIVDVPTSRVVKTLRISSLFPSAVVGADGNLYISGGYDQKIYRVNQQFEVDREFTVNGFAGGLAFIDGARLAVGYLATKNEKGRYVGGKLAILDTNSGAIEREADVGYFPYGVRFLNGKLYVTLVGEHKLLVLGRDLRLIKSIDVGRNPTEMCSDGKALYVVNNSADSLSVLDASGQTIARTINLARPGSRFGVAPTSCAVSGRRLYVTLAGTNAVAVLDKATSRTIALIPAGWYPTKVLATDSQVFVLSAKGIRGRYPNPKGPQADGEGRDGDYVLTLLKGSLSIIDKTNLDQNAAKWTRQVGSGSPIFSSPAGFKLPIRHVFYIIKENRTYDQVLGDLGHGNGDPNLTLFGEARSPIHHQLAREFVTLDNFFVNGEVSVLGHAYTTAGYASSFFQWIANLQYSSRWKGYGYATSPAVEAPVYLWDRLREKNIDYRFYGEEYFLANRSYRMLVDAYGSDSELAKKFYQRSLAGSGAFAERARSFYKFARAFYGQSDTREAAFDLLGQTEFAQTLSNILVGDSSLATAINQNQSLRRQFADLLYHYPLNFPTWDLAQSDLERVRAWKIDFQMQLHNGRVPQLEYIWLPNDHTDGSPSKILDPFQFMAQNDAALGHVVETISHSPIWKDSLILIVEDDAQNGPDHVDATRTIAFAAGPYVKRGAVVSDRYDQLSMLRTIEIFLGLEPMNLNDRMAAPMFGIFTNQPDYRPFVPARISGQISEADRQRYLDLAGPQ